MGRILHTLLLLIFFVCHSFCQNGKDAPVFNFGFEQKGVNTKLPEGWFGWGTDDYILKIDSSVQHSGKVSLLIESANNTGKGSYGCIAYPIPADYLGKEIEVRAYVRVQNITDSEIGLLLRIDDKNRNILDIENGHQKNLQGSGYWNYFSVSLPFPPKAKTIYIGAMLTGTGKLWVDDFQVLIDGKDISKAKRKAKIELKADRDHEFDKGSKINSIALTSEKTEDLFILGKVWGFLKYHHPTIAKGNFNWDYELFRFLPEFLESRSKPARNMLLSSWIIDLGEVLPAKIILPDSANVKLYPDLKWINDTSLLGSSLSFQLNLIQNAKRPDTHYYLELTKRVGSPEFSNENAHDEMMYPDVGLQLLALYRYWNIIEYYYPYKNLLEENWDDLLKENIPKFINAANELEYKLAVLSLIGSINDGNANIMAPNPAVTAFKGNNRIPAEVSFVENKAVVISVFENARVRKTNLKAGDVILKIENKNTEDVINERLKYTPSSNQTNQLRNIGTDLLRTNDTLLRITYKRNDSIKTTVEKCYSRDWLFKLKNAQKKDTCFKAPAAGIMYINVASLKNNYLEKAMPTILKTKGLIIDLRTYPAESVVHTLGKYLIPELSPFARYTTASWNTPGLFVFSEKKMLGGDSRRHYKGKVVVLVNETTQGAGEYHAMALRVVPRVTFIGSTTAGANGNLSDIYLPGAIRTMISGVGIYFPDGKETQRAGIQPDAVVLPTIKGIAEGRDELLETAIQLVGKRD